MGHLNRAIILVIDSGGIGALPDAGEYGDEGADTIGHVAAAAGGLALPNLQRLGLGNLHRVEGVPPLQTPDGYYGRMVEASKGKDTITGHWEMAGLATEVPFRTYPQGFPPEVVERFEDAIGTKILGNKAASGTDIIKELGEEHVKTGYPIVYTSADSVFQIACHEDVWPIQDLYRISGIAREQMQGDHLIGRIIARPFEGPTGAFKRTPRRKDYAIDPPGETAVDRFAASGLPVYAVGKIKDIYNGRGIHEYHPMKDNREGMQITRRLVDEKRGRGVIFTNLVDFDMLYGHRNDAAGYAQALRELDADLGRLMGGMHDGDVLFITADHGCDPTILSHTDHTREYSPMLAWGPGLAPGQDLGVRTSFGDLGATCLEGFGLPSTGLVGESFARALWRKKVPGAKDTPPGSNPAAAD
ncbi:MAG: phosphopentomutase [Armatimonadetes bacterium]|nr:phosphopentomutase [Armatimonadota bacterium]